MKVGDKPSYRHSGIAANPTDAGYDRAVHGGGAHGAGELRAAFAPEHILREYGSFTLDISAIDQNLMRIQKPVLSWLDVRNALLEGMRITDQPDAVLEVKWARLLNYLSTQLPEGAVPAQSELHGRSPVGGLAELLIDTLGLETQDNAIAASLREAEGYAFGDKAARRMAEEELGAFREGSVPASAHGNAHLRAHLARVNTQELSDLPPGEVTENPYGHVNALAARIRTDAPNIGGRED